MKKRVENRKSHEHEGQDLPPTVIRRGSFQETLLNSILHKGMQERIAKAKERAQARPPWPRSTTERPVTPAVAVHEQLSLRKY